MDNVKISLTINFKGKFMGTTQACVENAKKGRHFHSKPIYSQCKQVINMSVDAYNSMIDKRNVPFWSKPSLWNMCGKDGKLKQHFERIMHDLGGDSFEYTILDD